MNGSYVPPTAFTTNLLTGNGTGGATDSGVAAGSLAQALQSINDKTGSGTYTFVLSDAQKLVLGPPGGIFTIPPVASVAYPVGTWIEVSCVSASQSDSLSIVGGAGVTLTWSAGNASGLYAWGSQTVKVRNIGANVWEATLYPFFTPGLVKSDDTLNLVAATPGTDYLEPGGSGAALTGITITQVEAASTITPAADNTYLTPTSITISKGLITAIS